MNYFSETTNKISTLLHDPKARRAIRKDYSHALKYFKAKGIDWQLPSKECKIKLFENTKDTFYLPLLAADLASELDLENLSQLNAAGQTPFVPPSMLIMDMGMFGFLQMSGVVNNTVYNYYL